MLSSAAVRRVSVLVACLLLVGSLAGVGASAAVAEMGAATASRPAPAADAPDHGQLDEGPLQTGDVAVDRVVLRVEVSEDGDASWAVEYWTKLDDENTTAAFRSLEADIEENRSVYVTQFADRMRSTVAAAENATGREMRVENVGVDAEVRGIPQYGVVTYRFEWTGFASADGDRLRIGDALSGFFLDAQTRLVLSWPSGYQSVTVSPSPDETRDAGVTWEGPTDFGSGEPRVVVEPGGAPPTGTQTASPPGGATSGGLSPALLAALAVVLLVLVGGGWWFWSRRNAPTDGPGTGPGTDAKPDASEATADEAGAGTASAAASAPDDATTDGQPQEPPSELLSPEERVLKLVEQRGGRMKQQDVVKTFEWSAARTSQVVGNLRDDGELETFRIGRENVLKLPEVDGLTENETEVDEAGGESDDDDGASDAGPDRRGRR